jgi:hypothetical protein
MSCELGPKPPLLIAPVKRVVSERVKGGQSPAEKRVFDDQLRPPYDAEHRWIVRVAGFGCGLPKN